jgi:hypothetical protein
VEEMPPLAPKRRKASPSPPPSEASSDSGSDSDLHLHDHSDPEEDDSFFSARSAADDEQDSDDDGEAEEESQDEEEIDDDGGEMGELEQEYRTLQANQQYVISPPFTWPVLCTPYFARLTSTSVYFLHLQKHSSDLEAAPRR